MSSTSINHNGISDEDLKDFKMVFELTDRDGGGTLSAEEIRGLMELLGMRIGADDFDRMIAEMDTDGSGEVEFDEFVKVMSKPVDVPYTKADVLRAFKIFADEGAPPGCISADTLEKAVLKHVKGVDEPELLRLVNSLDINEAGWVDYAKRVGLYLDI
ncbi:MAG: hypothetical protein WDW38_002156 [Sanguina aurantia]